MKMSTKALEELTAPTANALTYDSRWHYISRLIDLWPNKCVPIKLVASKLKSNNVSLTSDDIESWKHDGKTTHVWDITIDANHAMIAISLPNKQLHVLDPVVDGRFRALSTAVEIRKQCNIDDLAVRAHQMPEHGLDIGTEIEPRGVCMLWCCLMVNCAIIGIDWENDMCALSKEQLQNALAHAVGPPYTMRKALERIPDEVARRAGFIKEIRWSHPAEGILRAGTYYHLYECELTFMDLKRADALSRRVVNFFGKCTLQVFLGFYGYTASAFIDLCSN